jgi:hypothetical protein
MLPHHRYVSWDGIHFQLSGVLWCVSQPHWSLCKLPMSMSPFTTSKQQHKMWSCCRRNPGIEVHTAVRNQVTMHIVFISDLAPNFKLCNIHSIAHQFWHSTSSFNLSVPAESAQPLIFYPILFRHHDIIQLPNVPSQNTHIHCLHSPSIHSPETCSTDVNLNIPQYMPIWCYPKFPPHRYPSKPYHIKEFIPVWDNISTRHRFTKLTTCIPTGYWIILCDETNDCISEYDYHAGKDFIQVSGPPRKMTRLKESPWIIWRFGKEFF